MSGHLEMLQRATEAGAFAAIVQPVSIHVILVAVSRRLHRMG